MGGYKTADLPSDPAQIRAFPARFAADDKEWLRAYAYERKRSENDVVLTAVRLYRAQAEGRTRLKSPRFSEPIAFDLDDIEVNEGPEDFQTNPDARPLAPTFVTGT